VSVHSNGDSAIRSDLNMMQDAPLRLSDGRSLCLSANAILARAKDATAFVAILKTGICQL
jgi:hypothetical protein